MGAMLWERIEELGALDGCTFLGLSLGTKCGFVTAMYDESLSSKHEERTLQRK